MKRKLLTKSGLIYLSVLLFLPCLAHATVVGTVDVINTGYRSYDTINVWSGYLGGMPTDAGISRFIKLDGTGEGNNWANGYVDGFCIELSEEWASIRMNYDVIMPADGPRSVSSLDGAMGNEKAQYLQELWGRYYNPGWAEGETFTSKQNSQAAAFQAAIWEIVQENFNGNPSDWDVTVDGTPGNGGFACEGVDSFLANSWLHSLDGTGPKADLRVFSYEGVQDFLVAVPEPATMVLLGIAGFFGLIKRKKTAW
jgi:hypothetical protein